MRSLVESLKRLYEAESVVVTLEKIDSLLATGKITQEEYNYILSIQVV